MWWTFKLLTPKGSPPLGDDLKGRGHRHPGLPEIGIPKVAVKPVVPVVMLGLVGLLGLSSTFHFSCVFCSYFAGIFAHDFLRSFELKTTQDTKQVYLRFLISWGNTFIILFLPSKCSAWKKVQTYPIGMIWRKLAHGTLISWMSMTDRFCSRK